MTPDELIAKAIRDFRVSSGEVGQVWVASDIFPFGHPERIEGVEIIVDPFCEKGRMWIIAATQLYDWQQAAKRIAEYLNEHP